LIKAYNLEPLLGSVFVLSTEDKPDLFPILLLSFY
jgi:hypothetical protein